jgi:hypothetical protein
MAVVRLARPHRAGLCAAAALLAQRRFSPLRPVDQVALFSDGLLTLALNVDENQPYAPFFTPLFAFAKEATDEAQATQALATFLDSERVNQRTHDDKTLVLVTRRR